jgi:hypothetical protein
VAKQESTIDRCKHVIEWHTHINRRNRSVHSDCSGQQSWFFQDWKNLNRSSLLSSPIIRNPEPATGQEKIRKIMDPTNHLPPWSHKVSFTRLSCDSKGVTMYFKRMLVVWMRLSCPMMLYEPQFRRAVRTHVVLSGQSDSHSSKKGFFIVIYKTGSMTVDVFC